MDHDTYVKRNTQIDLEIESEATIQRAKGG